MSTETISSPSSPAAGGTTPPPSAAAALDKKMQAYRDLLEADEEFRREKPDYDKKVKEAWAAVHPDIVSADHIILWHASAAAGAGLLPLPGLDLAAVTGIQVHMASALAHAFHVPFSTDWGKATIFSLLGSFGTGTLVTPIAASVIKFIPFIGTVAGTVALPTVAFASTYGIGRAFAAHFASGGKMFNFDLVVATQIAKEGYNNPPPQPR